MSEFPLCIGVLCVKDVCVYHSYFQNPKENLSPQFHRLSNEVVVGHALIKAVDS